MSFYRKYLQPEYGEAAPEVNIMEPQVMDMEHRKEWRIKSDYESAAAMSAAYQKCFCYRDIMTVRTENVMCRCEDREFSVRIYTPRSKEIYPAVIFYHGGAFSMNSIEVYEYVHRYLACYGNMIVIAPDYHLAPEYKFPKGLEEAYSTLEWAEEHIKDYGGDPSDISVCGDSSGGNFAAAVSMMARDRKGPVISRQILYYPLVTNIEEEMTESEKRYGKGYFLENNCIEDRKSVV